MKLPVSCNRDCGGGCPLTAEVENGKIIRITDSEHKNRWMSGCPRGYGAHRVIYHPDRLKTPVIRDRRTGEHKPAGWSEVLDLITQKLSVLRDAYGSETVIRLGGSGTCRGALHNTSRLAQRFLNCFGGYTETTASYSSAAVTFITPFVFGTVNAAVDAGSLMNSKFVLLQGANIADLRFGCELFNRLKYLRSQGVPIIVVDPRKTRTVSALGADWIKINPGTDAAFIAAVIYDLIENGGIDYEYIMKYCHGFEDYRDWLYRAPRKDAGWASDICGCDAAEIKKIADCYRRYRPVALIPGLSIQRNLGGEDAARMAMVLQAVTGNTGIPGGTSGGNIWGPMPNPRCGKLSAAPERNFGDASAPNAPRAAPRAAPRMRYVPVYTWPDVVLDGAKHAGSSYPPVKAAYNCGGNYLVQGADTAKSRRAFEALDFIVTHELFMTPTALASDVVLPVADWLERSDIVFPEGNFLLYSAQAVEPPPGVKTDYEIFSLLAERLGFADLFTEGRDESAWLEHFLDHSAVSDGSGTAVDAASRADFKTRGIFFGDRDDRIALADFIEDPAGCPLNTPSGKIEISSEKAAELGASPFPVYTEVRPRGRFRLVTPHERTRINSQPIGKRRASESPLLINAADAERIGLSDGAMLRVFSETGSLETTASVTDDIIAGVVSLDCSYSNILTSTEPTMPSGGSRTHSTFVDIEPL